MTTRAESANVTRFTERYRLCCTPPMLEVEGQALGTDYGSTGYTTREQANDLAVHLRLGPRSRLADIGAGSGWPGLYLAAKTGCQVVGTDLPFEGLRRARRTRPRTGSLVAPAMSWLPAAVSRSDPAALMPSCTPTSCAVSVRSSRVLAPAAGCSVPGDDWRSQQSMCQHDLDPIRQRRAHRAGPPHVAARRPYPELLAQAGFGEVVEIDVTDAYADTQRAWYEATESRARELRSLTSDIEFRANQTDRRLTLAAIDDGLLRRGLFTARVP